MNLLSRVAEPITTIMTFLFNSFARIAGGTKSVPIITKTSVLRISFETCTVNLISVSNQFKNLDKMPLLTLVGTYTALISFSFAWNGHRDTMYSLLQRGLSKVMNFLRKTEPESPLSLVTTIICSRIFSFLFKVIYHLKCFAIRGFHHFGYFCPVIP